MKNIKKLLLLVLVGPSLMMSCDEETVAPPEVIKEGEFVDLRPQQSSLKSQGGRGTCIVFAGVAALEAAYIRQGMGEKNLSEEFMNFTRKSFFLEPRWDVIESRGMDALETQLGHSGGGGGVGVIAQLNRGFRIPEETVMEYKTSANYYKDNYPSLQAVLDKQEAKEDITQRDYSNFNLEPSILSSTRLRADKYYGVGQYRFINDPKNTSEIEAVLKRGFEVVWDFFGALPEPSSGKGIGGEKNMWQKCDECDTIAHSMLIVGYDKRDADSTNHYFIVKNSWGPGHSTTGTDGDGYTFLSYDYVRNYGTQAGYILVAEPGREWPEVAFIGRWNFTYDGWKGELDIYHIPGMNDYTFEHFNRYAGVPIYEDKRIGTFYASDGKAFKINGQIHGNRIEFYFDVETPLLRYDELVGRRFVYYLDENDFMAGIHTDKDGRQYAGYAIKDDYLPGGSSTTPRPYEDASFLDSSWEFYTESTEGIMEISSNHTSEFDPFFLLSGTYTPSGATEAHNVVIKIPRDETNKLYIQIEHHGSYIGKHLNREAGLVTGNTPETGISKPFRMTRQ
ncbi:hypothetical protein E1176_16495 [Fulvivirga sp. RKSG066]|uniref:C1 family peptidase n=1 Tax=Fulvivirga aurantia TaxID=2529383 RepID=UPI0012BD43F9|nr:C1 family peptidase [Fulvivirga aurantia]MTI22633.1 hypothetical protein [Fulvivirga aurantia]